MGGGGLPGAPGLRGSVPGVAYAGRVTTPEAEQPRPEERLEKAVRAVVPEIASVVSVT